MPSIYLGQKSGSYCPGGYCSSSNTIEVSEEKNYNPSKIFHRFVHKPRDNGIFKTEPIKIYDYRYGYMKYLTITLNGYEKATLQKVEVYFNQYDTEKTPLLFVLHFKNGEPPAQNRYYKRSDFEREISSGQTKSIDELTKYEKENDILCDLIKETDKLNEPITYDIGKQQGDDGRNTYNSGKIEVKEDPGSDQQLKTAGFTRYKHQPIGGHKSSKACVIYNCNALLKDGNQEVENIQGQEYDSVTVYFGDKAKVKGTGATGTGDSSNGGVEDVPLLIELVKKAERGGGGDPEFYVHKRNGKDGDKYYWEKLTGETGSRGDSGNTLKDLLEDIGLPTSSGKPGFEKLREMMQTSGLGSGVGQRDLSGQLQKATGSKLQRLLQQKVNGPKGGKSLLQCLLERVQFNIVDSVVILMDKKDKDNGGKYGDGEIQQAISGLEPPGKGNRINRVKVNGDKEIQVNDETRDKGSCIQNYKYKVICHNITKATEKITPPTQAAGIRFFIPTKGGASNGSKYRDLSLYAGVSTGTSTSDTGPQNLDYRWGRLGEDKKSEIMASNKTQGRILRDKKSLVVVNRLFP